MKKKKAMNKDLMEELADEMAKEIQKEIDDEIMCGMLKGMGWHEVKLWPMVHETSESIDAWTKEQIKGKMWTSGLVWMFEDDKEANWFKLRWLA